MGRRNSVISKCANIYNNAIYYGRTGNRQMRGNLDIPVSIQKYHLKIQ